VKVGLLGTNREATWDSNEYWLSKVMVVFVKDCGNWCRCFVLQII